MAQQSVDVRTPAMIYELTDAQVKTYRTLVDIALNPNHPQNPYAAWVGGSPPAGQESAANAFVTLMNQIQEFLDDEMARRWLLLQ